MALTVGTHRLGLQSVEASSKSLLFVKLTDSALNAIAQFLKQNNTAHSTNFRPTIQFLQNSGTITIPLDENGRQAKFSFSLTPTEDISGPQGSFECLQSSRSGNLQTVGPIREKIQVQAEADSYQRCGEKFMEVRRENEKRTTQFIDRPGGGGGLVGSSHPLQRIVRKPVSTQPPLPRTLPRDRISRMPSGKIPSQPPPQQQQQHPPPSRNSSDYLSGNHPMLDRNQAGVRSPYHSKQPNSEIMKKPLRDRIVHLLAVRPYKKPELLNRIKRDGIREKDKNSITQILKQVSTMKDNTYHLLRHIWNDVSDDWPFYSEEERQAFRRRKPQNLTPPGSDGSTGSSVSSGHSSSSSHPASPQASSMLKRPHQFYNGNSSPASKKKRVSNYTRPNDYKSPLHLHQSPNSGRSPLNDAVMNDGKVSGWLMLSSDGQQARSSPSSQKFSSDMTITPASSPDSQDSAEANSMMTSNAKDFVTEFQPIANADQRRVYKAEFNKNYTLYRKYHDYLEGISRKFVDLENQLKQEHEGSESWKQLKKKIFDEYHANKKDPHYMKIRQEYQYLHDKLAHIKTLVQDFDTRTMMSS